MDDQGNKGYKGEEHFYNLADNPANNPAKIYPPNSFGRRHLWKIIAASAIALALILASTTIVLLGRLLQSPAPSRGPAGAVFSSTPTQGAAGITPTTSTITPTATVASTTTSVPTSQATSGLPCVVNISTWIGGSQDWTVHNGILYNDGTNSNATNSGPTIIAPCQPGAKNYAIEAKIQITTPSDGFYNCFGMIIRGSSAQNGWQGYKTDVCGLDTARISAYGDNNVLTQAPFKPGTTIHTYRAEVKDNTINFFIDGNLVETATDNRLLTSETGEGVGLYSQNVQLQVTSFQVTALS